MTLFVLLFHKNLRTGMRVLLENNIDFLVLKQFIFNSLRKVLFNIQHLSQFTQSYLKAKQSGYFVFCLFPHRVHSFKDVNHCSKLSYSSFTQSHE